MRVIRTFAFCAAAALITAGCEVRSEPATVGVSAGVSTDATLDEPQGEVVSGPGVEEVDVEPDPSQRVYIYDEGYPPGTYSYNGYYYYGGYRYPRDIFVNRYVQENIRQHKFIDKDQNRKRGEQIEQRHRTEYAKTKGVRQHKATENRTPAQRPENRAAPGVENRTPAERSENRAKPGENRTPAERTENKAKPAEEHRTPAVERPATPGAENRTPAERPENKAKPGEENRTPPERSDVKTPAERGEKEVKPENKVNPKEEAKPGEEPKREDQK
ncbi:MAG TPA: hypothetical protein VFE47_14270 [Tepidisphaeraceae bacterium]|jgi:hypothetical protein|nr:hypothetical protein [Tepidisphaeraceae bacterium]